MGIVFLAFALVAIVGAIYVAIDIYRFGKAKAKAEAPEAAKTDAGGFLYLQGGKTYYKLPKGEVRKVADYRMDLRPGSPDMERFKLLLNQAAEAHAKEVAEAKALADKNMRDIATEEAKRA